MYTEGILKEVLKNWEIDMSQLRDDISIAGSPERVGYRKVIEDRLGGLYIIEQLTADTVERKARIADTLKYLKEKALSGVKPYLKDKNKKFLAEHEGAWWQVIEYVPGTILRRPDYIEDGWRGKALAEFLIALRERSKDIPGFDNGDVFSIKEYIRDVLLSLKHQPQIIAQTASVLDFLEDDFFKIHDDLKPAFCHGDYHPVNIIWADKGINSVIDWEFLGYKPEIYDLACMLGCVGIEGPTAFASALVREFLDTIKGAGIWDDLSMKYMLEYMIAMRFAWIAEWVRKSDNEMLEFEIGYMNAMVDNAALIKRVLNI